MSAEKSGFFHSAAYMVITICLFLMLVLGATCTIWKLVSSKNTGGVPSVFGYVAQDVDKGESKEYYVFERCSIDSIKANDIILYNYSVESGKVETSIGKVVSVNKDVGFGEIVIEDTVKSTVVTRPASYLIGKQSSKDHFSYAIVGMFNSNIMLYLFTIFPLATIIILDLLRRYHDGHDKPVKNKKGGNKKPEVKFNNDQQNSAPTITDYNY